MHLDHRLLVIWVGAMVREHARATNDNPFYTLPYGITNKLKVRSPPWYMAPDLHAGFSTLAVISNFSGTTACLFLPSRGLHPNPNSHNVLRGRANVLGDSR
jgi:hypothetical protein